MAVEDLPDPTNVTKTKQQEVAEAIAIIVRREAERSRKVYREVFDILWRQDGWDVADANAALRHLDAMKAGFSAQAFSFHAKLGELLAMVEPESVVGQSPVAYQVNGQGQLVLDDNGTYPGAGG